MFFSGNVVTLMVFWVSALLILIAARYLIMRSPVQPFQHKWVRIVLALTLTLVGAVSIFLVGFLVWVFMMLLTSQW